MSLLRFFLILELYEKLVLFDCFGILKNQCRTAFKFHGEVAIQLFLNELFELPSKVDICVERNE